MKNNKGQNIIEYILLAVAAILVFLVILNPKDGPLKNSVDKGLNSTVDKLNLLSTDPKTSIRFEN